MVEARSKEVHYLREKRVYNKIPRSEIIGTRWIDINKGDDQNPNYRSRLVGKEFNNGPMEGLFAGTPPLEALRFLIHEAATVRAGEELGSKVLMINDVARAYFYAPSSKPTFVEICSEDLSQSRPLSLHIFF